MEISPLFLQSFVSLIAILTLAGISVWLGLGGKAALTTDEAVAASAAEALEGFKAAQFPRDASGKAALASDSEGRIMLLKRHGNKFVGRVLDGEASATANGGRLTIKTGEYWYGDVVMECPDAAIWASSINALKGAA